MQPERVFLELERPPLVSAIEWLVETFGQTGALDLSHLLVVLPGSRSMNRLLQLLVAESDRRGQVLTPPTLTTIGQLPEFLYTAQKRFASELAVQIAWCHALQNAPQREIEQLVGAGRRAGLDEWQPLAAQLAGLHRRLANDALSFASVARKVRDLQEPGELKRWEALEAIQGRYYDLLDEVDLWDQQTARTVAIERRECRTERQVVMLGTADLNRCVREMLAQLEVPPKILVAAPSTWSDRFGPYGGLLTDRWLDCPIDIPDSRIRIVDQPEDQAFAVGQYLSQLEERFSPDQITVGVPDQAVIPQIERTFNVLKIRHRNLRGKPLSQAGPVRLLLTVRDYLESASYDSFATLVRQPDLFAWLSLNVESESWLPALDRFQNENLPDEIPVRGEYPFGDPQRIGSRFVEGDEKSRERAERQASAAHTLNQVHHQLAELLAPLIGQPRPLAEWREPWGNLLLQVYGEREMEKQDREDLQTLRACRSLYDALADKEQVPETWQTQVSATQALEWAVRTASEGTVAPPADPLAVELVGWLDLPLDDAPVMIVTGMNDEYVPASENGHLFLPNSLCEQLGILDNNRRSARDAYALNIIQKVREHCLLVVGRRDQEGEPQKPSRLLFASDPRTVARRASAFFGYSGKADARYWLGDPADCSDVQQFSLPRPEKGISLDNMTVTSFREYIQCPYRFYLSRVMRLESVNDALRELDARAFGTLTHDVLEEFGNSPCRDSIDAEEITAFLSSALDKWQNIRYRGSRLPAVRIQVEQLRYRFERFAELQAERARQGWRIVAVEQYREHELWVNEQPFTIRGTIDRIDVNDRLDGKVAIWDYKTSDAGKSPAAAHYSSEHGWVDLQLPLYRHLASQIESLQGYDLSVPSLGYIKLPKSVKETKFETADWDADQLADADRQAEQVIRSLQQGVFWPPVTPPPRYSEAWAAICQDRTFEKWPLLNSGEASA
ncbi:MAG: PD-(D/E)XK nuclease family protein [Planctomycetota bacterium]|nr:PD-(D/E)XK nuclease family protein [Planctomycetota bacterium]